MRPKSAPSCRPGNGNLQLFNTPGNRSPIGTPQLIKEKRLDGSLPIATGQKGPKVQENQAQEVQNPLFQPHSPSISERSYGYTSIPIGYTHPNPSPRPHSPSPPIYEEIDQYQSPRKELDLTKVQDIEFNPSRSSTPSTGSSTITLDNSSGIHPLTSDGLTNHLQGGLLKEGTSCGKESHGISQDKALILSPVDGAVRAGSLSAKDYLEGTLSRQGAGLTSEGSLKSGLTNQHKKPQGKLLPRNVINVWINPLMPTCTKTYMESALFQNSDDTTRYNPGS